MQFCYCLQGDKIMGFRFVGVQLQLMLPTDISYILI